MDTESARDAALLIAREQEAACIQQSLAPAAYADPARCLSALEQLIADGYVGFVARDERRGVGVICGKTFDSVGFVPAHGIGVDPEGVDATAVVVGLLAALAPVLLGDGAVRFTIDHVALDAVGAAPHDAGFGRGSVFATQPARPTPASIEVDVRIGTAEDLDAIAALSAIHFLARRADRDVGLVTLELTSPAPRLCPHGLPYIGATASHPSVRGQGIGSALVHAVLDWAHSNGHATVSVDFDSSNPLSRPFWLGLGFEPTGYRTRRSVDVSYSGPRR